MEIILIIVGVLIIAYLLYLGNRRRQVKEAERREALGAQAEGHRSIASEHDRKASELADKAERERESARPSPRARCRGRPRRGRGRPSRSR